MVRRLLPTLIALGLGLVVLGVGLFALHGIFVREREDGRRALVERRAALEQYAQAAMREDLQHRLARAKERIADAERDPLMDANGLLLIRNGVQVLPRTEGATGSSRAKELLAALETSGPARVAATLEEEDDPFGDRLRIAQVVLDALAKNDGASLENGVRQYLGHRARFVVPTAQDVALTLWLMERFHAQGRPDPALLAGVLREGLEGASGARLEGLQRALLLRTSKFSEGDFALLRDRLVQLSERANVEYVDFRREATRARAPSIDVPLHLREAIIETGWFSMPDGAGGAVGVATDLVDLTRSVADLMRDRELIDASDSLSATGGPLAGLQVSLTSARMTEALAALHSRYAMKAGLLGLTALMAFAIVALAALAQSRKLRFVEQRSGFIATVSHELKTPLAAIRVMAETLERRVGGDYPTRIIAEADGLTRLVENILTFNRLDKARWDARSERVELRPLIEAVVEGVRELTAARLTAKTTALEGVSVRGDPELLRILFTNLVHNACRYCTRSPVELELSTAREGRIHLRDNGVGIPPESWRAVFEDFRRLKHEGLQTRGGSGLGLAICRRIMELHGGRIAVARSSSDGTTFELRFPSRR